MTTSQKFCKTKNAISHEHKSKQNLSRPSRNVTRVATVRTILRVQQTLSMPILAPQAFCKNETPDPELFRFSLLEVVVRDKNSARTTTTRVYPAQMRTKTTVATSQIQIKLVYDDQKKILRETQWFSRKRNSLQP
jgi:hypothetical protein